MNALYTLFIRRKKKQNFKNNSEQSLEQPRLDHLDGNKLRTAYKNKLRRSVV